MRSASPFVYGLAAVDAGKLIAFICCLVAGCAVALHAPGHMSMDTSMQLYEAYIGRSISWNPPFMSATMRWLGGGEVATSFLVLITCSLVYGGYSLTASKMAAQHGRPIPWWRILLAVVVVLNPLVAIYVGIVWKDVLFAAFLCGGVGLGFAAGQGSAVRRWLFALLATTLLAAGALTRQQGVFMAPVLLCVPIFMLANGRDGANLWARWISLPLVFVCIVLALKAATAATILEDGDRSSSVGYRSIMIFDIMGIIAKSDKKPGELAYQVPPNEWAAVRATYLPSRIDTMDRDPIIGAWFGSLTPQQLRTAWWKLLRQNPGAYLHHRAEAYATLIGLRGMSDTLPVHIGVEGNPEMLKTMGIEQRRGPRDLLVYSVAAHFFRWPIYCHAFWLGMVAVCAVGLQLSAIPIQAKRGVFMVLAAAALLYLAYIPTMIAADFRYLFGAIPLISLAGLAVLMGPAGSEYVSSPSGRLSN